MPIYNILTLHQIEATPFPQILDNNKCHVDNLKNQNGHIDNLNNQNGHVDNANRQKEQLIQSVYNKVTKTIYCGKLIFRLVN